MNMSTNFLEKGRLLGTGGIEQEKYSSLMDTTLLTPNFIIYWIMRL